MSAPAAERVLVIADDLGQARQWAVSTARPDDSWQHLSGLKGIPPKLDMVTFVVLSRGDLRPGHARSWRAEARAELVRRGLVEVLR